MEGREQWFVWSGFIGACKVGAACLRVDVVDVQTVAGGGHWGQRGGRGGAMGFDEVGEGVGGASKWGKHCSGACGRHCYRYHPTQQSPQQQQQQQRRQQSCVCATHVIITRFAASRAADNAFALLYQTEKGFVSNAVHKTCVASCHQPHCVIWSHVTSRTKGIAVL